MVYSDSMIIIDKIYPLIKDTLSKNSKKFTSYINTFFNSRHNEIFAIAPYTRILYNQREVDALFRSLNINEKEIEDLMKECFFYNKDYRPACAKEAYIEVLMCCIRYYIEANETKTAEAVTIYTCFTGKMYASQHSHFWQYPPKQEIMDYVVNNMLTDKFDLKKEGTVFGAIKKLSATYIATYRNKFGTKLSDDEFGKLVQQLRDRVKSFLFNIFSLYMEAAENKYYMNYETDDINPDEFRITQNDATKAARLTEAAMNIITSQKVSMQICNKCKNQSVRADKVYLIMEAIFSHKENIPKVRRVFNIIICDYMSAYPKGRVGSVEFIQHSIKAKPNTKSKMLIELKQILTDWLNEDYPAYRNISREATQNDYRRSVLMYLVLIICKVAN